MKLRRISVRGFRAFAEPMEFEIADVNVIGGPNGFGKTSLFDAVEWGLFGSVSRLSGTRDFTRAGDVVSNKFSSRQCSVLLEFRDEKGKQLQIARGQDRARAEIDGRPAEPDELLSHLGFGGESGRKRFLRNIVLPQEKISEFVRVLNPRQRYDSLLSLLDFGLPQSLIASLDRVAKSVAEEQRVVDRESAQISDRLGLLEEDVKGFQGMGGTDAEDLARARYEEFLARARQEVPEIAATNEGTGIDSASTLLRTIDAEIGRSLRKWRELLAKCERLRHMVTQEAQKDNEPDLAEAVQEAERAANSLRQEIEGLDESITKSRAKLRELDLRFGEAKKSADRFRALLAEVRDTITGDFCPVCKRPIAKHSLLETIDVEMGEATGPITAILEERESVGSSLAELQRKRDSAAEALRRQESQVSSKGEELRRGIEFRSLEAEIRSSDLAKVHGLGDLAPALIAETCRRRSEELEGLRQEALEVSESADRAAAARTLPAKLKEAGELRTNAGKALGRRAVLGNIAEMLARLRQAVVRGRIAAVAAFVESYKSSVSMFYGRLSPHPLFTDVDFEVNEAYRDSELYIRVRTRRGEVDGYPSTIFSTSQLNALALCVFLPLNARAGVPLSLAMMDDPVQAMDDLNVLGFCDVLREMKPIRQIFISTHDMNLYGLLLNKLRPLRPGESVKGFRFEAWSEEGPVVREQAVDLRSPVPSLENIRSALASPRGPSYGPRRM